MRSPTGDHPHIKHRSPLTTAIYAKLDRDALVVLARPWPVDITGGVS
jgi:integrase/recombinase XerD